MKHLDMTYFTQLIRVILLFLLNSLIYATALLKRDQYRNTQ